MTSVTYYKIVYTKCPSCGYTDRAKHHTIYHKTFESNLHIEFPEESIITYKIIECFTCLNCGHKWEK